MALNSIRSVLGLKFVSHTPGVGVVLEANEDYWRKVPNVKRITIKGVPEGTTRLAMLKGSCWIPGSWI